MEIHKKDTKKSCTRFIERCKLMKFCVKKTKNIYRFRRYIIVMFVENSIWSRGRKIALAIVIALTVGAFGIKAGADNNWLGSAFLAQVRATIDQLTNKNTQLFDKYQQASQDLQNNQSTVNDLNNQVSSLKQQLEAKQTELNNTVATMSADKQQALADKQKEIDEKIQEINQKIAEGDQKVAEKQKEVDALNAKLQDAAANDEQLQKALADANATKDYAQKALDNSK